MRIFRTYFAGSKKSGGINELLVLAIPMVISTAADGVMTFTDRLFMAKVGSEQMNAVMGGGVGFQVLTFFFIGLLGYSTALVAQYFGAGEKHNSSKTTFQAIIISVIAWPVIILLKPLIAQYFVYLKIPEVQLQYQTEYFNIMVFGGVFAILRHSLSCFFSGIGKTKIVMRATIVAMLLNVILDYVLIFGKFGFEAMGIKGAAIASISGSAGAVIMLFYAFFHKTIKKEFSVMQSFRLDFSIMKKLFRFGYPAGLELFLNFFAFSTMISIFHSQGNIAATASTIMFNWDLVSFIPLLGVEIAVTSLVGRYMGAGRPQVAHRAAVSGIKIGVFYSIVILALFITIPEVLVRVFEPVGHSHVFESAVPVASNMIRIASIYVLVEAVMVALVGALRGAGDTFFTMIASVTAHWMFVPIIYCSLKFFNMSVEWSWFLLVIAFLLFSFVLYFRFKSGKWKKIKVIG
ncbi:MAG TPA: MATE family efflux transporter [Bacteroidales bacterium]|nr:MATE family efflux transporter [Bacteroidales bacterium]